jgi:SP family myo-inositol transporter-like MFS transporter 13
MVGRLIIGFSIGIASMNLPLYISEICPTAVRGRVVALYTFLVIIGQLLANIFSLLVANEWKILLGVNTLISVLQFILMRWIPESPRWLASQGKQT